MGAWLDAALALPQVEIVGLVDVVEEAAKKKSVQYQLAQAVIGLIYKPFCNKPDRMQFSIVQFQKHTTLLPCRHSRMDAMS